MNRTRIVTAAAVLATGLFLMGCGAANQPQAADWHQPGASPSASADAGGAGGGEGVPAGLASSSAPASASASAKTNANGVIDRTGDGSVALTFDDGPDPKYTPQILAILKANHLHATFCLVGTNAKAHPDLVRAIVADGHTICNHTWNHDMKLGTRGEAAIRADLQRTNDAILAAAPGAKITYFRHPGGAWTPTAVKVANSMGLKCAGWEVDPQDWDTAHNHTGEQMKQHILKVLRANIKPGSIVLMHDAGGDRTGTMAAVQAILPELMSRYQLEQL
jgi:peptidoglycan/xylan/chitin deacetylase (PgdA/CDA1 family)